MCAANVVDGESTRIRIWTTMTVLKSCLPVFSQGKVSRCRGGATSLVYFMSLILVCVLVCVLLSFVDKMNGKQGTGLFRKHYMI